ncbi:Cmx/CmrA family chloramphenicol efflux MFS transporter [Streptosporangium sp. KLBMP 9127]|nr:MFS transporter [Streptosporangium sp. KLBMP 9127]
MPLAVYILGLAIFAQGTSEFMLSGLLLEISTDLGVSVPDAGLLTSAFAIGMVIGGPLMAVATLRWPRRRALLAFLAVFAAVHVLGALSPGYEVLLVSRVVSAVANAGFWAVAAATALSMVAPDAKARAMSVVVGGITLACVAGVPAGAVLGQEWGWRSAFWAVAVLSVLAMAGVLATIPGGRGTAKPGGLGSELRAMADGRLWVAYAGIALTQGALFCVFTYLAPLLTKVTGLTEGWVPVMLVLFGAGSVIGITVGGRVADAHPFRTLYLGLAGLLVASGVLAVAAGSVAATVVLVFLLGLLGFGVNPALSSRAFYLAGDRAPTLVGATTTSAFNIGNTVGPWLGGLTISAGFGFPSVAWVGAAMVLAALGTVVLAARLQRRPVRIEAPAVPVLR